MSKRGLLSIVFICLILTIGGVFFLSFIYVSTSEASIAETCSTLDSLSSYTSHDPINISSDSELAMMSISGSGIDSNPFILEGWKIITDGIHGISIQDTTQHFIISNCWIETSKLSKANGIYVGNVTAGTAKIINNTIQNNRRGIDVRNSDSVEIVGNIVKYNVIGINVYFQFTDPYHYISTNLIIKNNTCSQNYDSGMICCTVNSSITWNLISDHIKRGLFVRGTSNQIHHNSFINNEIQAEIIHHENELYNPLTNEGNYWSDHSETGNYIVGWDEFYSPEIEIIDPFPLKAPPHNYIPPKNHFIESLLILLIIMTVGILGGIIIVTTFPHIIGDRETITNIYTLQIRTGFLILLIQNMLILGIVFVFTEQIQVLREIPALPFLMLHLDLLGFLLIASGYIFYSKQGSKKMSLNLIGGISLLGWVICRIVVQYIVPYGINLREYQEPLDYVSFIDFLIHRWPRGYIWVSRLPLLLRPDLDFILIMKISFLIGGFLLFFGSNNIWRAQKNRETAIFMLYGVINMITVLLIVFTYSSWGVLSSFKFYFTFIYLLLKTVAIPLLGVITFFLMWQKGSKIVEKVNGSSSEL